MRAGRGALPPASPTSPRTPRREGEAWGGGLCGRCGSPAPCLPCGGGDGSLPLPALRPNVPDVAACGGRRLFGAVRWRGAGCRRKRSGLARGWAGVRTRPPPHASPSLPSYAPQTGGGARNAPRPALMLRFHPLYRIMFS